MIGWILLAVAVGLLVFGMLREPFEATPSIKAPPYDAAEKRRVFNMARQRSATPPYTFLGHQDILMNKAKQQLPNERNTNKLEETAGGFVTPAIESFFNNVFKPATTPITKEQVKTFMNARGSDIKAVEEDVLTTYFVGQSGVGTSVDSKYAASLAKIGQNAGYLISNAGEAGAAGAASAASAASATGVASAAGDVSASSVSLPSPQDPCGNLGRSEVRGGVTIRVYTKAECDTLGGNFSANGECIKKTGGSFSWDCRNVPAPAAPTAPAAPKAPTRGPTAGGTTGGSSVTSPAPNAGGGGKGKGVFGPTFTSLGTPINGEGGGDSSKTNQYPSLMGGMGDSSVRTPSGIRNPSQNWLLSQSGALPSTASMGSDENSGYLPYSRVPGDQDLIPDPYRLSRNYSTSSYSSKTDPVPFLTDFSAFSK